MSPLWSMGLFQDVIGPVGGEKNDARHATYFGRDGGARRQPLDDWLSLAKYLLKLSLPMIL